MAKHFKIVIDVAYDEAHPIPDDMEVQLRDNIARRINRDELLNDDELESVIENWNVTVEAVGGRKRAVLVHPAPIARPRYMAPLADDKDPLDGIEDSLLDGIADGFLDDLS